METKKKRLFVTLFYYGIQNIHLKKEVSKIPFYLSKYSFNSILVTYQKDESYPSLESEVEDLKIEFLGRRTEGKYYFFDFNCFKYLFQKSKEIDVLNLYHLRLKTIIYGFIYKIINKNGFLYLKLDLDLRKGSNNFSNTIKSKINDFLSYYFIHKTCDLLSVENSTSFNFLKEKYKIDDKKLLCLPSGVDYSLAHFDNDYYTDLKKNKENLILTSGRLGMDQKNNEMLLEAIAKIDLRDWKIVLMGKIENDRFNKYLKNYFEKYPEMISRIIFTGLLSDRQTIENYFKRSKIFCLTSRWESFGLVLIEAMYFGNYVITTSIESANDITDKGKHGKVIESEDIQGLAKHLELLINEPSILENFEMDSVIKHVQQNFLWSNIVRLLNDVLIYRLETVNHLNG